MEGPLKKFELCSLSQILFDFQNFFVFLLNLIYVVKIEGCNCTCWTRPYAAPVVLWENNMYKDINVKLLYLFYKELQKAYKNKTSFE